MKRVISCVMAAIFTACISITAFAASSSVSIKNNDLNSKPVTYTYQTDKNGETVKSIKSLMTNLEDLSKQSSVVQTITITSESSNAKPVSFALRLSLPETVSEETETLNTPTPEEYSALEYYNIKITDASDNLIYESDNKTNSEKNTYKDIPLGVLNRNSATENQIYNITVSVNKEMKKAAIAAQAAKLDWSIVSAYYLENTPAPVAAPTALPATPAPTEKPNSENGGVTEDKNGVVTLSKGEYLCGRDIDEGRYTMTGSGKVHIYTSEGVLKSTIALKSKNDKSANGVDEYVIYLKEGEKISVESQTKFTPYKATKATSKPTSTPKSGTASSKATSTPNPSSNKTNPKTGDSAPIIGIVSLGILAAGAFVFIEIKKRKEN